MKIYFDGCSWTEGAELENEKEERFSKVLCNELGACLLYTSDAADE